MQSVWWWKNLHPFAAGPEGTRGLTTYDQSKGSGLEPELRIIQLSLRKSVCWNRRKRSSLIAGLERSSSDVEGRGAAHEVKPRKRIMRGQLRAELHDAGFVSRAKRHIRAVSGHKIDRYLGSI